jgi:hypothetical protein
VLRDTADHCKVSAGGHMNHEARTEHDPDSGIPLATHLARRFGGREPTDQMAQVLDMFESFRGKAVQDLDGD